MAQVYISHSVSTKKYAIMLSARLGERGIKTIRLIDTVTSPYANYQAPRIKDCDLLVVFMDKNASSVGVIRQEVGIAHECGIPIIAVRLYPHPAISSTMKRYLENCTWYEAVGQNFQQIMDGLTGVICAMVGKPSLQFIPEADSAAYKTIPEPAGHERFVFISYAHRDKERMNSIINLLREKLPVWYDEGIIPASAWDEVIAEKLSSCGYVICFVSEAYLRSENCADEMHYAREQGKKLLLVFLDDVKLNGGMALRFGRSQAVFASRYSSVEALVEKILSADGLDEFIN